MTWLNLAIRNGGRRPLRTLVSLTGVAIAMAALFSLLQFQRGYQRGMADELDHLGAHILVVPKGCPYDAASIALHGARWPCYLKAAYLQEVRQTSSVLTAAPALMNAFYGPDGNTVYVGVQRDVLNLKRGWRIEGRFPERAGELLVGSDYARRHGWRVGQSVTLPGLEGGSGTLSGILQPTGGADDTFIYMRLEDAQRLFHRPAQLTHILVRLKDPDLLDQAVTQLRGCDAGMDMNVVPLAHLFQTIRSLMASTRVLFGSVALVALLIAAAGVSNTVLMAVVERTGEIGTMRALGASRWDIFRLFWLETLGLCLAGGAAGIIGAFLLSQVVEGWLRSRLPFAPTHALLQWEWSVAGACLLAGAALGTLAALLPAWRAASLSPMEAIRAQGGLS